MKHFNTDDLIVPANQEELPLHDSHVTAYKRHHGIYDSHVECHDRFQSSLHDSHVARYFEYLAKPNQPSHFRDATGDDVKAIIICGVER